MPIGQLISTVTLTWILSTGAQPASLENFQKALDGYVDLRKDAGKDLPSLPKEASAEQISTHQKALQDRIRTARQGAQPGDVIVSEVRPLLRARLDEVMARRPASKQKEIATGNPAEEGYRVPLKVNAPYPVSAPRSTVPTEVLAALPPLPKDLEYRFYADHLLLLDTQADLIVDFVTKAADNPATDKPAPAAKEERR